MKKGPFAEHSNQLWNVSAVSTWSKVNSGLIKMYKVEVIIFVPYLITKKDLLSLSIIFPGFGKISCYPTCFLWFFAIIETNEL
jgi:hypothetical protein